MRFNSRQDTSPLAAPFADTQAHRSAAGAVSPRLRHPSLQLLDAVMRLAGTKADLISHAERPWASVTFTGMRHTITLHFSGEGGADAADDFIRALPEHEFTVRGQLVADAAVSEVLHITLPHERVVVDVDLLLLDDG